VAFGERVRAWAEGGTEPHPDDATELALCRASTDPVLQAAAHVHTAAAHLLQFRFEQARAECTAAEELLGGATGSSPRDRVVDAVQVECWAGYVHAEVLDELGHYDAAADRVDASAELADAHRLELSWARAVSKRIWIARQQGDAGHAAALLRELAARLSPRSHLLCAALGSTLAWLGRPETALSYAQRCLTLPGGQGRRARDHRDLARVLTRLERFDEARHQLDLATVELSRQPPTLAGRFLLQYARYELALALGEHDRACAIAVAAAHGIGGRDSLRRHLVLLALAHAQGKSGRIAAMTPTLAMIDTERLGAEHRALARRLEAAVAESQGDWRRAAEALGEARQILASRHLAIPVVLLIEAELAVADPFATDLIPGAAEGRAAEFNRALATRDQLLMAAAKDLRGPIAVFELAADLLGEPDVDGERLAVLVERGLAEMELLVGQLRDTELDASADGRDPDAGHALDVVVGDALTRVAPIAAARKVELVVTGGTQATVERATAAVCSALTSVLALTIRAAPRGGTVSVAVTHTEPRITIELTADGAAPSGWAAVDSITASTAGGPTVWALAATQLADAGGQLAATCTDTGRVRITFATSAG